MTIVGVMMVKNEDRFVGAALRNVADFCDRMIIIDTGSSDHTLGKIEAEVAWGQPKQIDVFRELKLRKTHPYVEPFVGTDTWVFGVDGDEIYDPAGLKILRGSLISGVFDGAYQVKGMYLHGSKYTEDGGLSGYLGPPSHNPTKLYNFANIDEWPADGEHILFQSKTRKVKKGSDCRELVSSWNTDLRCLHMRFFQRSRQETFKERGRRLHGEDVLGYGSTRDRGGRDDVNERLCYRVGDLVTVNTAPFGRFDSWRSHG